jgi:hypothetical protein
MKIIATILLGSLFLLPTVRAQTDAATATLTTNVSPTQIEALEEQTNVIIIKGIGPGGSLTVGSGILTVQLKESFIPDNGARLQGLVLDYEQGEFHRRAVVDYDEIAPLLKAMDYIAAVSHDVSGLPDFEAAFKTKAGFQVIGIGNRRQTGVQMFLNFEWRERIPVSSVQMAELRNLIAQSQTALDALNVQK